MRAGNWEIAVLLRDNQLEIAKMTDQLGQTFFIKENKTQKRELQVKVVPTFEQNVTWKAKTDMKRVKINGL